MKKEYIIGLDIGTTSVGYSVVEADNQKVMRKGNKALWGASLFDEANPASARRQFRNTKRRYDRRRDRIKLLQEEFKDEIFKVDKDFFTKMKQSFFAENDTKNKTIAISNEEKRKIKNHYKKYPTIYHLRNKLINNKEVEDIRLVYLAIHHIIKNRGNFLYSGSEFNVNNINIIEKLKNIFEDISNCNEEVTIPDCSDYLDFNSLEKALLEQSKSIREDKVKDILKDVFPTSFVKEFCKLIKGNQFDISKLLGIESNSKDLKIKFDSTDYDEKYDDYEKELGINIEILDELKDLYDSLVLQRLFKGSKDISISSFMVNKYNIHKEHLQFLRSVFKIKYNNKLYNKVLNTNQKESKEMSLYGRYIRNKIDNTTFIKELNKYLEERFSMNNIEQSLLDKYTTVYKEKMENGDFLPRITDIENGVFPYQLHKLELIKIIENQGEYYPFLKQTLNDGTYKLVKLLEFRIPYYVGPLTNSTHSEFAWMIKNETHKNEKITPYNFDEVINKEDTAEEFIKRMISNCTYLLNEKAIPNNSILYSKFKVMNELKQIRINGHKIDNNVQKNIYNNLFLKTSGTITDKKFKEYLYASKDFAMYKEDIEVTGYSADKKFANNMQSYIDFFGKDGIFEETEYTEKDAEQIIEWITIFEDKDILETKVRRIYPELSDIKVKQILSKKYKGWSNLSKKLLTDILYKDEETNTNKSILDLMEETEENFMQILNNKKYKFQDKIDEYNNVEISDKLNYDLVKDLATSPATKRGIYRSLKVVKELVDYIGYNPQMIVIEMARENNNSGRTLDRKKYITKLYDAAKNTIEDYKKLNKELKQIDKIDRTQEKLLLYFLQEGKSLYSGKPLDIDEILKEGNGNSNYEVDHIIPRTLIKDDSIDNKALVFRDENQIKSSNYVLPEQYRRNNIKRWEHLKSIGLMSAKKFYNLKRSTYSNEDIEGFINRQLVETRQITKHVANIIKNQYKQSKVVYLKAQLSHNYRERYELFKFREINDYHHAHDAYLAAVLGEYKEKHLKKDINFEYIKELNSQLLKTKNYKKLKYGYVINSLDTDVDSILTTKFNKETGEVLFDAESFNKQVEKTLYRNDILISKKVEYQTGEFFNQTRLKKGSAGVPLKKNLPTELYGSYTNLNSSYATLVKYIKKGKESQKLVGIPIYYIEQNKYDNNAIEVYLKNLLKLSDNDSLIISNLKIPFNTLLDWDGKICYLVGAPSNSGTVEVCNGKQFHFDAKTMIEKKYSLKRLFSKYKTQEIKNDKDKEKKQEITKDKNDLEYEKDLEEIIKYIVEKMEKEYLLYEKLIPKLKEIINFNDLSSVSLENKENIIKELFKLLKCNSVNANFKFLDSKFSDRFGRIHNKTISHAKIHNKSVTGIKDRTNEF